jgi:hypothetical protein
MLGTLGAYDAASFFGEAIENRADLRFVNPTLVRIDPSAGVIARRGA